MRAFVFERALPSLAAGGSASPAFRSALLRSFVGRTSGANVGISGGPTPAYGVPGPEESDLGRAGVGRAG